MGRRKTFEKDRDIKHFASVQLWLKQVRCMWHLGLILSQTGHLPQASVTCSCPEWKQEIAFSLFINCESEITWILYASPDPHLWGFKYLISPNRLCFSDLIRAFSSYQPITSFSVIAPRSSIILRWRNYLLGHSSCTAQAKVVLSNSSSRSHCFQNKMAALSALTLLPHGLLNDSHKIPRGLQTCLQGLFSPGLTLCTFMYIKNTT